MPRRRIFGEAKVRISRERKWACLHFAEVLLRRRRRRRAVFRCRTGSIPRGIGGPQLRRAKARSSRKARCARFASCDPSWRFVADQSTLWRSAARSLRALRKLWPERRCVRQHGSPQPPPGGGLQLAQGSCKPLRSAAGRSGDTHGTPFTAVGRDALAAMQPRTKKIVDRHRLIFGRFALSLSHPT